MTQDPRAQALDDVVALAWLEKGPNYSATLRAAIIVYAAEQVAEKAEELLRAAYRQPSKSVVEAVLREREACANLCEQIDLDSYPRTRLWPKDCAAAIRARGEKT